MPVEPTHHDFMHRTRRAHFARFALAPWIVAAIAVVSLLAYQFAWGAEKGERPELRWGTPTAVEGVYPGFIHGHVGHYTEWTIEYLTKEKLDGEVNRKGFKFFADEAVPVEWRPTLADYRGAGMDRGHISPASDNTFSEEAMRTCFSLANMCPQAPKLNRGPWRLLEEHIRDIAREDDTEVWVVTMPVFAPASDDEDTITLRTIGKHRVFVPTHCAKCALIKRGEDLEMKSWILPNVDDSPPFDVCATSVDNIEAVAGFNVFSGLDDKTEDELEATAP